MADKIEKAEPTLEERLDKATEILIDQIRPAMKPPEQLQQTQALLNMAHAKERLLLLSEWKPTPKKSGTSAS